MSFNSLDHAIRERQAEIDELAAEYVRDGFYPWAAIERATATVNQRRRDAAMRKAYDRLLEARSARP